MGAHIDATRGGPQGEARGGVALSLIIPAYNEAVHLRETLPRLRKEYCTDPSGELIVVDDGSTDTTAEVVEQHIDGWDGARLIRLPWNQGKGSAIKAGMALASGGRVIFMDADLSADIADVPRLAAALDHADVAIGSRSIAGSRVIYNQRRSVRKLQSKFFNGVACAMVDIVASDTQCGFKAFRADAGKMLFHLCEGKGFAFDVEVLALAQLLQLRVTEVPVDWVESVGTSVRPIRDPFLMMRDLLRTRRRCRKLEERAGRFVWEVRGPQQELDDAVADVVGGPGIPRERADVIFRLTGREVVVESMEDGNNPAPRTPTRPD